MSKEIDQYLKKFLKENEEHSPGMTYYTGNWGQDLEDNLTPTQRKKLQKQMQKLSESLVFTSRRLPDNVGGFNYIAYIK